MSSRFVRETDYMLVVMQDHINLAGAKALVEALIAHPQFERGMRVLWDARSLTRLELNFDEVREFGKFVGGLRDRRGGGRSALVANDDTVFGTFRVHQLLNQTLVSYEFHVFRDFDEAHRWLFDS